MDSTNKKGEEMKIILFDIETSPILAYVWGLYEQNVLNVVRPSYLLCFGWKELGKKELHLEIEKMLHEREMALQAEVTQEIQSKERILVAELQQGDNYTKRARPTIVYVGLIGAIVDAINYIDFTMPSDFWYVWAGVCGVWIIGRSAEKVGSRGRLTAAVTGGKPPSILEN